MVFHWSLSDSKSQVSRTLLSILAILNNAVVWMVSTRPPTSKSSSPFSNPLVTVPNALITSGIIFTCMFHRFFNSLARSRYLSFFSHSFSFILWSAGTVKSLILQVIFFLLIIIKSGLLAGIRWSVCMLKSHWSLCMAFSRISAGLCIYHLLIWCGYYYFYYYYYLVPVVMGTIRVSNAFKCFLCFPEVMTQFELERNKLPNYCVYYTHLYRLINPHEVKHGTMCKRSN